jgi:hypothetical protein
MRAALLAAAASLLALAACGSSSSSATTTGAGECTLIGSTGGGGAGGGGSCPIESSNCTNCVQSVCLAEASACMGDPACATANCELQNCICQEHVPRPVCEERFVTAGSAAAAAAACLAAQCAKFCGW